MERAARLGAVALLSVLPLLVCRPVASIRIGTGNESPSDEKAEMPNTTVAPEAKTPSTTVIPEAVIPHTTWPSNDSETPQVLAALGWGVSPIFESFTKPVCRDASGSLPKVVRSLPTVPVTPSVTRYSSLDEKEMALATAGMGSSPIIAPTLRGILTTLNLKFRSQLDQGWQILHVRYDVPTEERVMTDPIQECNGSAIEQAIRGLSRLGNNSWTDRALDQFFEMYGIRVVDKVTYGGRLDIFRLDDVQSSDMDLAFLGQNGSWHGQLGDNEQHTSVFGGDWEPQPNKTLMQNIDLWMQTIRAKRRLSVLHATTFSMELLFPQEHQKRVRESIARVSAWQSKFRHALQEINFYRPRLEESRSRMEKAGTISLSSIRAVILPPVGRKADELLALLDFIQQLLSPFCIAVANYAVYFDQAAALAAGEAPPLRFKHECQNHFLWACGIRVPQAINEIEPWYVGRQAAVAFEQGLTSLDGHCKVLKDLVLLE